VAEPVGESAVYIHHPRTHKQVRHWPSMTLQEALLAFLALGILLAHLATLRLLWTCRDHLGGEIRNFGHFQAVVADSVDELVRIGGDMADQIETFTNGAGTVSVASTAPPLDIRSTILELIASKFVGLDNATSTEQEWAIQSEEPTQTTHDPNEQPATN